MDKVIRRNPQGHHHPKEKSTSGHIKKQRLWWHYQGIHPNLEHVRLGLGILWSYQDEFPCLPNQRLELARRGLEVSPLLASWRQALRVVVDKGSTPELDLWGAEEYNYYWVLHQLHQLPSFRLTTLKSPYIQYGIVATANSFFFITRGKEEKEPSKKSILSNESEKYSNFKDADKMLPLPHILQINNIMYKPLKINPFPFPLKPCPPSVPWQTTIHQPNSQVQKSLSKLTQYRCQAATAGLRPSLITVLRLRGPWTPHSSPLTSNTTSVSESEDRPDLLEVVSTYLFPVSFYYLGSVVWLVRRY